MPCGLPNNLVKKLLAVQLLGSLACGQPPCAAQELREVIVSHSDKNGILQLFRMKEDGSESSQLTHSKNGCRMPSVSPDGRKLIYVEPADGSLALWLSDISGNNIRPLIRKGRNLLPSWLPDSRHVVWMKVQQEDRRQDPASKSRLHLVDTRTGATRRLFSDPEQIKYSNAMASVAPDGQTVAFVSNRSGSFRVWVSKLDGSKARLISPVDHERDRDLRLPIEQKVPVWSPDGKWIAHWEGVEMIHMSPYTGVKDPEKDRAISKTFSVWVAGSNGKTRRRIGAGDDPSWSPDGFVTRAFPDRERGGPKVMIETQKGEKALEIVPRGRSWGRFSWIPARPSTEASPSP